RSTRLLFFQLSSVLINSLPPRSNHAHFIQLLRPAINFYGSPRDFRYNSINSLPSQSTFIRLDQLPAALTASTNRIQLEPYPHDHIPANSLPNTIGQQEPWSGPISLIYCNCFHSSINDACALFSDEVAA